MKLSFVATLALFSAGSLAFPRLSPEQFSRLSTRSTPEAWGEEAVEEDAFTLERRKAPKFPRKRPSLPDGIDSTAAARKLSKSQTNCGPNPCLTFKAEKQYVSTTGQYAYRSPATDEIRGPCPGLNAAANHGYMPRSGIANIAETVTGLGAAYFMSVDLAGFLAAYAIALDGDIVSMSWSIGGPMPLNGLPKNLLSTPQGISYSHNKYEGDTSMTRNDAYLNHGDAHTMNITRFTKAYEYGGDIKSPRFTLDRWRHLSMYNQHESVTENPYYFAPLFSTTLVAPAAYNFIINFMSNHSEENKGGWLDGNVWKSFFAASGEYPNFKYHRGQERIPDNWYKRASGVGGESEYNAVSVFEDLLVGWAAYPSTFRFGGNVDGTNTYEGIDIHKLTGGTFNKKTLFKGVNFACLFFQTQQQAVPDQLKGFLKDVTPALDLINKFSEPIFGNLGCPKLSKYDQGVFNKYPGRNYNPKGKATNY